MPDVVLAIETSQRAGGVAISVAGGAPIVRELPDRTAHDRGLLPGIDALFAEAGRTPGDCAGIGVSVGPGGFTGLRVAVSCAKMLGFTLGAPLVAVPTALVVTEALAFPDGTTVLVTLASKGTTTWATTLRRTGDAWTPRDDGDAAGGRLVEAAEVPLDGLDAVIGDDHLPAPLRERANAAGVRVVAPTFDVRACLRVTGWMLAAGETVDPLALMPVYPRPPEAVTLWESREGR